MPYYRCDSVNGIDTLADLKYSQIDFDKSLFSINLCGPLHRAPSVQLHRALSKT